MSPARHRYRFPIPPRISVLCALRVSAVGYPFHRFPTALFSASSELLFSQLLSFHKHLRCPMLFSSVHSVPPASVPSVLGRVFKSFAVNGLPPLVLSYLSFSHGRPLFSAACRLFLRNTGGGMVHRRGARFRKRAPRTIQRRPRLWRRSRYKLRGWRSMLRGYKGRRYTDTEKGTEFMGLGIGRRR